MQITLDLHRKTAQYLDRLLETGLWGKTREEVAARLIDQALWITVRQRKSHEIADPMQ